MIGRLVMSASVLAVAVWTAMVWYNAPVATEAESILALVSVIVETLGGLVLLVGWKTRAAAIILVLWFAALIAVRIVDQGLELGDNPNAVLRDLAVIAGLLMTAGHGAGPMSIDHRQQPPPINLSDSNVLG